MGILARDNPELLRLIARFHGQPWRCIHSHRWPAEIPRQLRQFLRTSLAGNRRLSRWAVEHWQLEEGFQSVFETPRHRVALLDPPQLASLIKHCGAALHSRAITQAIDRDTAAKYKDTLGDSVHAFALKRAHFLLKGLPPELTDPQPRAADIARSVAQQGELCVAVCLYDAPSGLHRRTGLMLPADRQFPEPSTNLTRHAEAVWEFVRRLLLTEVAPEVGSCFK